MAELEFDFRESGSRVYASNNYTACLSAVMLTLQWTIHAMCLLFPSSSLLQSNLRGRVVKNTDWFSGATFRKNKIDMQRAKSNFHFLIQHSEL